MDSREQEDGLAIHRMAWAFAKLGVVNKDMMQAVVAALEGSVAGMKEWAVCVCVPDFAGRTAVHFCMLGTVAAG